MLWYKLNTRTANIWPLALIVILPFMLSGCVRPLYGNIAGTKLRADLASIQVQPIPSRMGHYLGNELIFLLNGDGSSPNGKYTLSVKLNRKLQTPLVDTVSGRATSASLLVDAQYNVIPHGKVDPIISGVAFTTVSYDRSIQRYANIRATRDAEIRAAKILANQIHVRLATRFTNLR